MTWTSSDLAGLRIAGDTSRRSDLHMCIPALMLVKTPFYAYNVCAHKRPAWNPANQVRIYPNALFGFSLWVGLYLSPVPTTSGPERAFAFHTMPKPRTHIALYGGIGLKRGFCRHCNQTAIVIDDEIQCCGRRFEKEAKMVKRICNPDGRRFFSSKAKKKLLEEQDYRCAYCWKAFGEIVLRNGKPFKLQVHYDHQVPFAYVQETRDFNILAACHVCNGLKSDHMFQTIDECALFLIDKRADKGYNW